MKKVPVIDVEPQDVIFQWKLQKVRNRAKLLRLRKMRQEVTWKHADVDKKKQFLRYYGFSNKYLYFDYEELTTALKAKWAIWLREQTGVEMEL